MIIKIKYCGGCNPKYDRSGFVEKIKTDFPKSAIIAHNEPGAADYAVVVCGCSRACADHSDLEGRYGKTVAAQDSDYTALYAELVNTEQISMQEKEEFDGLERNI